MTTSEYSRRTGIPLAKVQKIVSTIPGASKIPGPNKIMIWDIPDSAAPLETPPAEGTPQDFRQGDPPKAKQEDPPQKQDQSIPGWMWFLILAVILWISSRNQAGQQTQEDSQLS